VKIVVLTTSYPREESDPAGYFLSDAVPTIPPSTSSAT
jgi:hypothetical protein